MPFPLDWYMADGESPCYNCDVIAVAVAVWLEELKEKSETSYQRVDVL